MTSWQADKSESATKSFLGHLEDLRSTLLWCAGLLVTGMAVSFRFTPRILMLLKAPLRKAGEDPETFLRVLEITGGFSVAMRLVLGSGLLVSLPFMVLAVARFVFPGLTERERRSVSCAAGFAVVLFAAGVGMGYYITLPVALRVMLGINRWLRIDCPFVILSDYIGFTLKLLVAFGVAFEMPVVILALGRFGLVSAALLRSTRRHVIVGIMVAAMFLTPPDPVTLLLMAVPMTLLYELCILIIAAGERRRK